MTTRHIETEHDRNLLLRFIEKQPLPFTSSVTKGGKRTAQQNRLAWLWYGEIAHQLEHQTAEEVRGECKLRFGVPILRAENDDFAEKYDQHVKGLPYETKVALMMEPLDFPITRLMTTRQQTAYLDAIHRHYSGEGIVLTDPGELLARADMEAA